MSTARGGAAPDQGELAIDIPDAAMELAIQYIPWDLIFPDPAQPRVDADAELKASIAAGGIRQAITVRPRPGAIGQYQIVDGERRWRGAEGVQRQLPCVVRTDLEDDAERLRAQLITNTGKELTPVEEARAMAALMSSRGGSITELAAYLGKPVTTVSQRLNLMQLGPWLELIQRGQVKYTHAAEVLLPYRGCPDEVHHAVIRDLGNFLEVPAGQDSAFESSDQFKLAVVPKYSKHLYPIAKRKGDVKPIFETGLHDRECSCGGIEVKDWEGKRRYCGNPEWWQPREKAVKKEERAKAKKSSKKSGATADAPTKKTESYEEKWKREDRERKAYAGRLREECRPLIPVFAAAVKKASTKPGGALERFFLEQQCDDTVSKAAAQIVPRGTDGDGFMRWVVFGTVHANLTGGSEYGFERELVDHAKALGVDVSAAIKRAKAEPKPEEAEPAKTAKAPAAAKGKTAVVKKRQPAPQLMQAVTPDATLAAIVGAKPLSRVEVTKKLWVYIKQHGLQDKKNRRMINADEKLKPLFGGKAQVSMFDMTKLIAKHFKKAS